MPTALILWLRCSAKNNAAVALGTRTAARARFARIRCARRLSLVNTIVSATVKYAKATDARPAQPKKIVAATILNASRGYASRPRILLQNAPRTQTARQPRSARSRNAALARLIPTAAPISCVGMGSVSRNHLLADNLALNGRNGEDLHLGGESSHRRLQSMILRPLRARNQSTMDEPTACSSTIPGVSTVSP